MKGFVSILKGRNFKNGKINNSSFFLKTSNDEREMTNIETNYFPKINKIIYSKMGQLKSSKNINIVKKKKPTVNENYEDLFFHFLKTSEKIFVFEAFSEENENAKNGILDIKITERKLEEDEKKSDEDNKHVNKSKINVKYSFYHEIYLKLVNNKQKWNNFFFPIGIYKLMYRKSKIKKQEIFKYSIKKNINYEKIIGSYDKQYTSSTLKHNWELSPRSAYINYSKIYQKNKLSQSKEVNQKQLTDLNFSDVVVKVDYNSHERTLIYGGKLFNVYVEEYLKNRNNNIVSMHIQDLKPKKEIIYNSSDLWNKLKKDIKEKISFKKNKTYNKFEIPKEKKILKKKLKSNYVKFLINSLGKKNKSFFDGKTKIKVKRFNTETNQLSERFEDKFRFSFNSLFNNNEQKSFSPFNNFKNKDKVDLSRIEIYNKNINKIKINGKGLKHNQLSFSPSLDKPIIINNNINNIINKKIDKSFYSKLTLKKKINGHNKKNNYILNFFKNNSDF